MINKKLKIKILFSRDEFKKIFCIFIQACTEACAQKEDFALHPSKVNIIHYKFSINMGCDRIKEFV